jgi:hypothetical protein
MGFSHLDENPGDNNNGTHFKKAASLVSMRISNSKTKSDSKELKSVYEVLETS